MILKIEPIVHYIVAKFMLIHYFYLFENAEIYRACRYAVINMSQNYMPDHCDEY
ncbi:MAG: hypothetical protein JWR76_872 [Mucilaginibacter sp.]|nr:hypothetical protein [Mucilaginibacter sp.]